MSSITLLASAVLVSLAAPFISVLKDRFANSSKANLEIKLSDGRTVALDLASGVSRDRASELVEKVVVSAMAKDQDAVKEAVNASHSASMTTRH